MPVTIDCPACHFSGDLPAPIPAQVTLSFRSTPSGADVLVDGKKIGSTPMVATFATGQGEKEFLLNKVGYVPARSKFAPVTNGFLWAKLVRPTPMTPVGTGAVMNVATFTTDEPKLGGLPVSLVVMGVLGLGVVGYLGWRVWRGR